MKKIGYVLFPAFAAALGGFLFGYDTAVVSGTIGSVARQFALDDIRTGWYVGCALVGSIVGVAGAGWLSDRFGRRTLLRLAALLFIVSSLGCMLSTGIAGLVLYRVLGGTAIGVASIVSPLYIAEIAVPSCRGRLVGLYQLAVATGFLVAYSVNYFILDYAARAVVGSGGGLWTTVMVSEYWRGMLGAAAIPAAIFLVVAVLIPESPRWQVVKKDVRMLFERGVLRLVVIGAGLAILGQFMGVNAVLYYGPEIFARAGLPLGHSMFYQVVVGGVNVVGTVLGMSLIDRIGRKRLIYYGVSGMVVSLFLTGLCFVGGGVVSGVWLLAFMLTYIFSCAVSICVVIWVLLSEMYPARVRGVAMSVAGLSLWVGTYLIGQLTPWLMTSISPGYVFWGFGLMCVPYVLIIRYLVPETTGKSLEDIERRYEHN